MFIIVFIVPSAFSTPLKNERISIKQKETTLGKILEELETKMGYTFLVRVSDIDLNEVVSINATNKSLSQILDILFVGKSVKFEVTDNQVSIYKPTQPATTGSQQRLGIQVSGTVTDTTGEPILGVSISIKGTGIGTVTDVDGNYSITSPDSDAVLVFSYLGYITQERKIDNQRNINVTMTEDMLALDEVVVTGYTSQKKSTLTGSVSVVSNKELTVTKNENVVNMLAGKLPGLRIHQQTSQPGATNTVIDVRGFGEPLFVVDGVPRDKEFFGRMDPEEIESISLLKDGAAVVYGLRAANGVMLITTKSGASLQGKVDITYTGNYTLQQFLNIPKSTSAAEWMTLSNEKSWLNFTSPNYLQRLPASYSEEEIRNAKDYNWINEVFRKTTPQTQHNLSINGGNDRLRYFMSMGFIRQDGSYRSGSIWSERWNLRSNIDAQITQGLKIRVQLGAILNTNHEPHADLWTVYRQTWRVRPHAAFYANDNPEYLNGDPTYIMDGQNPLALTNSDFVGYNLSKSRRLNGTFTLTYDIPGIKGLTARALFDYGLQLPERTSYDKTYYDYTYDPNTDTYARSRKNSPTSVSRRSDSNSDTDMQLGLVYDNRFGNHSVSGIVLFEEIYNAWDWFQAYRELVFNTEYLVFGETLNQTATGGTPGDRLNQAVIGEFRYDYASKYLLDFRFRADGSSRYPKGSRWGFFPGISLGWRISEESFIKNNTDFLSNLKIRASYAETGDDADANNYPPAYVGYSLDSNNRGWVFLDGANTKLVNGYGPTTIPNPNLTWYTVEFLNIALDFAMFQQKFSGTFELFRRNRSGLLATSNAVIPGTVGANLPQENLNATRDFGWEIELVHRNRIADVNYFVTGQFSATRSMRTKWLETPASNSYDFWKNRDNGRYTNIMWGQKSGGMFSNMADVRNYNQTPMSQSAVPGDWWLVDWNGDGIIDGKDDYPVATSGLPLFNFGLSMGANYKNFDLTMNFQGVYKMYTEYTEIFATPLTLNNSNTLYWFMDRWHPKDPYADYWHPDTEWIPGYYPITSHDGRNQGTNDVHDATYIRLKTMEIGYSLPTKLLANAKIKNLRMYISGYNLLTICGLRDIDPERPSGSSTSAMYMYPNNKTYTIGASIKF